MYSGTANFKLITYLISNLLDYHLLCGGQWSIINGQSLIYTVSNSSCGLECSASSSEAK